MADSSIPLLTALQAFDGGATPTALQAVAGVENRDVDRFLRQALDEGSVREHAPGRYELVSAAASLSNTSEVALARSRHAEYFAEWACEHGAEIDVLESELPNLQAGLKTACAGPTPRDDLVILYAATVVNLFLIRQRWDSALSWLQEAVAACERQRDDEMLARVYTRIGLTHCLRGSFQPGYDWYAKAAPIFERSNDKAELATIEGNLGLIALALSDTRAEAHLRKSATLSSQLGTRSRDAQIVEHALVLLITRGWDEAASFARSRLTAA